MFLMVEVHRFLLRIGVGHLNERTFYRIEKLLVPSLFQPVEPECDHYYIQAISGDLFSFDGSWEHPRNVSKPIGILTRVRLKKIILFSVIEKCSSDVTTIFNGVSQVMEAEVVGHLLARTPFPAVHAFVVDGDQRVTKASRQPACHKCAGCRILIREPSPSFENTTASTVAHDCRPTDSVSKIFTGSYYCCDLRDISRPIPSIAI
jgi:hypothetical protein